MTRVHHGRRTAVRDNVWAIPLIMALGAVALAVVGVVVDHHAQADWAHLPRVLRLSPSAAQVLLAALTGASMTVVALVVSLTMVVLSLVASNFGPRQVGNFIGHLTTQVVIGAFVGTFIYSAVVLGSVFSESDHGFVPVLSAWTAVVAVVGATGVLIWWVHDLTVSIQTAHTLVGISQAVRGLVAHAPSVLRAGHDAPEPFVAATAVCASVSGYVQAVD
jgi:uncharacterized membrane protein